MYFENSDESDVRIIKTKLIKNIPYLYCIGWVRYSTA